MKNLIVVLAMYLLSFSAYSQSPVTLKIPLKDGWKLISNTKVADAGSVISVKNYSTSGWYTTKVPTTVIGALIDNGVYQEPFKDQNLSSISGTQFDKPWWFRKSFYLPASENGKTVRLRIRGINYKANIWVNGQLVADSNTVIGPFRFFEFDIKAKAIYGDSNFIAIQIRRPFKPDQAGGDLAIDFADWIHYPADYHCGIVNDVEVVTCKNIAIQNPLVTTKFDLPSTTTAHLDVDAEVVNYSSQAKTVVVNGIINGTVKVQQTVALLANETKTITFKAADYAQLNITNPKIWWPWQFGNQDMNFLQMNVTETGNVSDSISTKFGIRQVTSTLIGTGDTRQFYVNGKPIMINGGGWSPELFLRRNPERMENEIKLTRDLNMNAIRSEGKFEDDLFYELCDKYGILVMSGWMCCGSWQYPTQWNTEKRTVAMESARSIMYWLRNKACLAVWMNGSDYPCEDPSVETDWIKIETDLKWPNPIANSAANADVSTVSGNSGFKMLGPYDWVPPMYWESDTQHGGAWGFASEISPGASIPPIESLKKYLSTSNLWPVTNATWQYHLGTLNFGNTDKFNAAMGSRYGTSTTIEDYTSKGQAMCYEGHRAMFEAYNLNKNVKATGVIQWMLNNAWPSMIWHTYDYYLYPGGTYFGLKKSMEPVHIQYSYKSKEVIINNALQTPLTNYVATAEVFNTDGTSKYTNTFNVASVNANGILRCFTLPAITGLSTSYFLKLVLKDNKSNVVSINWYWLSTTLDKINANYTGSDDWIYTPQTAFADFKSLSTLSKTNITYGSTNTTVGNMSTQTITVKNTGTVVAFQVHLRVLQGAGGDDILPAFFDDNYFALAPGETRVIQVKYDTKYANGKTPTVDVTAWNMGAITSIEEEERVSNLNHLIAYPNPSNCGEVDFEFNAPNNTLVNLCIYDLSGKKLANVLNDHVCSGTHHQVRFDTKNLTKGVYLYVLSSVDGTTTGKLLIE